MTTSIRRQIFGPAATVAAFLFISASAAPAASEGFQAMLREAKNRLAAGEREAARQGLAQTTDRLELSGQQILTGRFVAAGSYGAEGDTDRMRRLMREAEAALGLPDTETAAAYWDAAALFTRVRDYEPVHIFVERTDWLRQEAHKRYDVTASFVADVPGGAGGWATWPFTQEEQNRHYIVDPYIAGDAQRLIADITADRPVAADPDAADVTTWFSTAFDDRGWHLFVSSQEPDVGRVMDQGGAGGSTLEMFFTPGLQGKNYYQWILNQATGKVDPYHWNTPHRHYRQLELTPWSLNVHTVTLDDGWATLVTIAWEAIYDRLPFRDDDTDTWRVGIIRWTPHGSVTWGGARVHETGRWGRVKFERPSPEQELAIRRRIIRRAWSRYQSASRELYRRWNGPQGDETFFRQQVEPLIERQREYEDKVEALDTLDAGAIAGLFNTQVPVWMEFKYEIEDLRRGYLTRRLIGREQ